MNAYLNIQIRVLAAQAQKALGSTAAEIRAVERASATATKTTGGFMTALNPSRMVAFGSRVQWTGRQLNRNFTLPLAVAAGAATKFALDNEAAFVRIQKVYGDTSFSSQRVTQETEHLRKTFEALSNQFGVNQAEVLKVAGDWAAAGASGVALARSTKLTLETMVLGELNAADATKALISIQAQYGQQVGDLNDKRKKQANSTKTLADTIGILNMVENQTGISMAGLIEGMARSAGAARTTGVTVQELAAYMAALVPAAGNATTAGTALKTIFSRVIAPTGDARDIMQALGIQVGSVAWQSKTAAQRLQVLAEKTDGLTNGNRKLISAQEAQIASVIGSRLHINKFATLMQSITDKTGYFARAMHSSGNDLDNFKQAQKELNQVLDSSPHRLKQMGVIIQNSLAKVIQPLLPVIVGVASEIAKLADKFSNMNPVLQKFILAGLAAIAILGPMLIFFGSLSAAIGEFIKIGLGLARPFLFLGKGVLGLATAPFKLIGGGFKLIGEGGKAAVGGLKVGVAAIKQFIAFSTYASGITGVMARGIVSAYEFMRLTVVAHLAVIRMSMLLTFRTGLAQAQRIVELGLAKIATRFAIMYSYMNAVDFGIFVAKMKAGWIRLWASITGITTAGNLKVLAVNAVARLKFLAGEAAFYAKFAVMELAFQAKRIARYVWLTAQIWVLTALLYAKNFAIQVGWYARELVFDAAQYVKRTALYVGFQAKWLALRAAGYVKDKALALAHWTWEFATELIFNTRRAANRAVSWAVVRAIDVAAWTLTQAIWAANFVKLRVMEAAHWLRVTANRAISWTIVKAIDLVGWATTQAIWLAGQVKLRATQAASWAIVAAINVAGWALQAAVATAGAAKQLAIWAALGVKTVVVAIATSTAVQTIWLGMWRFLTNPAMMMRGIVGIGKALWGIIPWLIGLAPQILRFMIGPWGLAITAIIALAVHFRDQLVKIWDNIKAAFSGSGVFEGPAKALATAWDNAVGAVKRAFNSLPAAVTGALIAVWNVVKTVAMKVYEAFSYLNPFAHHSPSLVENVTAGMDVVVSQYKRAGAVGNIFRKAYADLQAFGKAVGGLNKQHFSDERANVSKVKPQALGSFDALVGDLDKLQPIMDRQKSAVDAQQQVVDAWQNKLDAANAALDAQSAKLDNLKSHLQSLTDEYDKHKQAMENYASAPLQGMQAMSDAIFENDIAQKKLQLQMMQMEAAGQGIEDTTNKMSMLAGAIESAQGDLKDLKGAGAGSDVTGPLDKQIADMQKAYDQLNTQAQNNPMSDMQKQLDMLQKQGQMLQLQQSIDFDPLTRQIDQLAHAQKEISYDDAVKGINAEKAAMAALQPQIDSATAAVNKQQAVVDAYTRSRDAIQASYDLEHKKLERLNKDYQETADLVSQIEQALRDAGQAASDALGGKNKLSPALQNFQDAQGASFPDPGGQAKFGMEGAAGDQLSLIDQMTKDSQTALEDAFGKMDILGPVKKKWGELKTWVSTNIAPVFKPLGDMFSHLFDGVNFGNGGFMSKIGEMIKPVTDFLGSVIGKIKGVWRLIEPDVKRIFGSLVESAQHAWKKLSPELAKWGQVLGPFLKALAKVVGFLLARFIPPIKIAFSVIGHVIGPVLHTIIDVITRVLQVLRGAVEIFSGIVNGDWKMVLNGLKDIFVGTFGAIWSLISGIVKIIVGIVEGLVGGIIGFFKWLWDELVGHSIIPDLINGIIFWFKVLAFVPTWIWNNIIKPIFQNWDKLWPILKPILTTIINVIAAPIKGLIWLGQWVWDHLIKPIINNWGKISGVLMPILSGIVSTIAAPIKGLIWLATWVWDHILSPIVGHFSSLWDKIGPKLGTFASKVGSIFSNIGGAIVTGINFGIKAINGLISGLNWIGSHVPGLSFHIDSIPELGKPGAKPAANSIPAGPVPGHNQVLATGGVIGQWDKVGAGFKTDGPRAIVGEGRRSYPEYVIPTDPRYRKNALNLLYAVVQDMSSTRRASHFGLPAGRDGAFGIGGDISDGWNAVKGGAGKVAGAVGDAAGAVGDVIRKGAVIAAFKGPKELALRMANKMPNGMRQRDLVKGKINDTYNWAKGVDAKQHASGGVLGRNGVPSMPHISRKRISVPGHGVVSATMYGGDTYNKVININGNLEFPNIKSGDDAEDLISSLENLVA